MKKLIFILVIFTSAFAQAVFTELGLSYSYKKTSFSKTNYVESEMRSLSLSFYIWERVAIETSYSQGTALKKEEWNSTVLTVTQDTKVYGADLILAFADRKATFQPFIKGGAAYIQKKQTISDGFSSPYEVNPKPGVAPSYGVGFKLKLTDTFSLTGGIDAWQTPLDDGSKNEDMASRVGISWIF